MAEWSARVKVQPIDFLVFENLSENKPVTSIHIANQNSSEFILFKVKTTKPKNYIVRPNQGIIAPGLDVTVKIQGSYSVDDANMLQMESDKFLVQLIETKERDQNLPSDALNNMWIEAEKNQKAQILQQKLKVKNQTEAGRSGSMSAPRSEPVHDSPQRGATEYNRMHTAVDGRQSVNQSGDKQTLEREKQEVLELRRELQRINSTREMKNLKDSALAPNVPKNVPGSEGFTMTHLLLVAMISMVIGAISM